MKIDPNLITTGVTSTESTRQPTNTGAFEDLLKSTEAAGETQSVSQTSAVQSVSMPLMDSQHMQGITLSEEAIDLLDTYAQGLSQSDQTLKSLSSMMEQLSTLKTQLDDSSQSLMQTDPLREIMQDVSSTIQSEMLRFSRGDLIG